MSNDNLLFIARLIGLIGLGLLVTSGIGGALLASRTAQRIKFLKGQTFKYHRLTSLLGAGLLVFHPIPILLASRKITGLSLINVFVPFTAPKQTVLIALGTLAAYVLVVVTVSSLRIKSMRRSTWRALHYGAYLVLVLGLAHGLLISGEFKPGEMIEFDEPEKAVLVVLAAITLLFPIWRVIAAKRHRGLKLAHEVP